MLDYKILDLGLVYYKNIIKNPQQLIEEIESLDEKYNSNLENKNTLVEPWLKWKYDSGDKELMFCWQKFIPQVTGIPEFDIYKDEQTSISSQLFAAIDTTFEHYTKELYPFAQRNIKSREKTMHLLKYNASGHLPAHQDQGISSRVLSVILYLNDDYVGGDIEFKHSKIRFKPEAGSVLFFPSNFLYVHEVHPVYKGPRYALPNWFHNIPFENKRESNGEE
jgi:hypothetical protein